ncbi:hypothetical protein D3C81_2230490 [compost metagenome]
MQRLGVNDLGLHTERGDPETLGLLARQGVAQHERGGLGHPVGFVDGDAET